MELSLVTSKSQAVMNFYTWKTWGLGTGNNLGIADAMGYWKHSEISQKTTSVFQLGLSARTFFEKHFHYLSTFMQIKFIFAPFETKWGLIKSLQQFKQVVQGIFANIVIDTDI